MPNVPLLHRITHCAIARIGLLWELKKRWWSLRTDMAIFHLLNNLKSWFVYVFDACIRLVLSFHACWYINGIAAARAILYAARIMAGRKKDWDGAGVRSKWFPHIGFFLSDFLEFRMRSRWRCVFRRCVPRGQSKSMAPTWGRAGALAGVKMIQTNTSPWYPCCCLKERKYLHGCCVTWLLQIKRQYLIGYFYHDLSISHYRIWTVLIDSMEPLCFDWCRLANSIFYQNSQA